MEMVNGYVFLDLTKSNVYAKALKVLGADKPVVIKDGGGSPYFVDSLTLDGTNVVITKGGKTITIANDNTITNVGDIQPHLWYHGLDVYKSNENSVQCHILNNDDTPINSVANLIDWATSIDGQVMIQTNGCIVIEGVAYVINAIIKNVNNEFTIVYVGSDKYEILSNVTLTDYFTNCNDSVNQLF